MSPADGVPASPASDSPRGSARADLLLALIAHPTVQLVRFLAKICLAWFVSTADFGEVMFAGLLLFGAGHVAMFGLDEALIYARVLDATLWKRMRRTQHLLGVLLALATAAVGLAVGQLPQEPLFGAMMLALAPMVWCANLAVLPSALLVRERRYKQIFIVDVCQVVALSVTTVVAALCGAGPWSLVAGWYANAFAAVAASTILARPLVPRADGRGGGGDDWDATRRYGAHLTGSALLGYVGERLDSFAVRLLGPAILGLYEFALHLSHVFLHYTTSLVERLLFPTLAEHHRAHSLTWAFRHALRLTLLFILPAHVLLAVLARPMVSVLAPEEWRPAAALLTLLALASGLRSVDIVAVTALKAAGESRRVFQLGCVRLAFLALALVASLRHGVEAVAAGVLAARGAAMLVSLAFSLRHLGLSEPDAGESLTPAGWVLGLWSIAYLAVALFLREPMAGSPWMSLTTSACVAVVLWVLARWLFDRRALQREFDSAAERVWALTRSRRA